jgi:hypothetical protein
VSTVGRDEAVIRNYIHHQEAEDERLDQMNYGAKKPTASDPNPRAALATRLAALSGSQPKAPGSAGGYLLGLKDCC